MNRKIHLRGLLSAFWRAKAANVAMMFGLSLVPLAIATGVGLDYAHALMVKQSMADALDAAALAVGASPNTDPATAQVLAQKVFDANYHADTQQNPNSPGQSMNPQVGLPVIQNGHVTLTVSMPVQTTLLGVIGQPTLPVGANSTVMWAQTKLWVALVLDNTGSMCEPDSNPCPSDTNPNIKINALKAASHSLLGILQNAAVNPGDMEVSIVPFAKDVNMGTSNVSASWIDWTDWNTQYGSAPSTSYGPGSNCPLSLGCVDAPGSTTSTNKVPSSGMICPDAIGSSSTGQAGHYYDGCYNSTPTKTSTTTTITKSTPTTITQTCTQTGSNNPTTTCNTGTSVVGSSTNPNTSTTVVTSGYTGDSSATVNNTVNGTPSDGPKSCNGQSGSSKVCTFTRTTVNLAQSGTAVATGVGPYNHTWVINDHSLWRGCVMDRNQNDDATNNTPGTPFPAENDDSCPTSSVTTLSYQWSDLNAQIDAMVAGGGTNQTIGLAHGMQTLVTGAPYNAPTLPANTKRYIILLSDGLNTMDRWYGNGSSQSTSVDNRMTAACTNAKAQGFIIYTVFVDLNGTTGNSSVLQNCATDSSKYFDLTTTGAIVTAFNQIALEITNLRVSS